MRLILNQHRMLSVALFLAVFLALGCGDDSAGPEQPQTTGTLVAHSDCGGYVVAKTFADIQTDQSAIAWSWDGQGKLDLRHINGAFNCCPNISCQITVDSNMITVTEMDEGMCDCLCLTDVDYKLTGLKPGDYLIRFVELSVEDGDEKLEFSAKLGDDPLNDTVTVTRDHYPWMPDVPPVGSVTGLSECGGFTSEQTLGDAPVDSACVVWDYDDTARTLYLTHENAVYNCGLYEIGAVIAADTGVIWIEERALIKPAYCICPFDIDMEINNMMPELYFVMLIQSYWDQTDWVPGGDTVRFWIDLTSEQSGHFCYDETVESW